MSLWRLALTALITLAPCTAICLDTSRGPVSPQEGDILWKDGSSEAQAGLCADAVPKLQRLVDRYAGHAGYLRAHLLLGDCLLKLGDAPAAITALRYFTSGSANEKSPESHELFQRGRVLLGRAYLAAGKGNEAYLTSMDIAKRESGSTEAAVEGLLIKARALLLLGQDAKSEKTVDSATQHLNADSPPELRGEAAWTRMKLTANRCEKLPSSKPMNEAQARQQLERRGLCVLEAVNFAHDALAAGNEEWSRKVRDESRTVLDSFSSACMTPPAASGPKRSATELRKYRAELTQALVRDCTSTLRQALPKTDESLRDAFAVQLERLSRWEPK
jgi:hypothetical protein